jgi:intracellular sulfur oxidation DsrE/DsrF family protein
MRCIRRFATGGLLAMMLVALSIPAWADEPAENWEKMVFHLDDTTNARWALLLANSYLDDSPKAKLVIVAYGPGIDFLLEGAEDGNGNPYDVAVSNLLGKGVNFRVCAATLGARQIPQETVLDEVEVVPSGLAEIARLQLKEGYAYLKP